MRTGAALLAFSLLQLQVRAADWPPVDPADLALKTPKIDKNADAEAIFWDVRVNDDALGADGVVLTHHVRIKIFTDRGRDSRSTVNLSSSPITAIDGIGGRTVKPDGTVLELKSDAVLERVAIKTGGVSIKTKSFTLPGVEAGSIVEYRWRETRRFTSAHDMRLYFQRDIPVWQVRYHVKPLANSGFAAGNPIYAMRAQPFQLNQREFVRERDGFYLISASNLPAFREEPLMPPKDELISWVLIFYADENKKLQPEQYWQQFGKELHRAFESSVKVNDAVKKAAQTAMGDASTPDERLARLADYCRLSIKMKGDLSSGLSAEQNASLKENKTPADTLRQGAGTAEDIDLLFAAMAISAGFDVRFARLADRGDKFFSPTFLNPYFLQRSNVAVKVRDNWRFFEPSSRFVAAGMLPWQEEGVAALLSDPKEALWVTTPLSGPEKSVTRRVAKLRLTEDGVLEGDVEVTYAGHLDAAQKVARAGDSPQQQEEDLIHGIQERMSTAILTNIRIENAADVIKPLRRSYHLKVGGYAERVGRRLLLQPAVFQRNIPAVFTVSERQHPVYFTYPWAEEDEVAIEIPPGYALDHAEAPARSKLGQVGDYDVHLWVTADGKSLMYQRKLLWNGSLFPVGVYPQLKAAFDFIHEQDNHTVLLQQGAAR